MNLFMENDIANAGYIRLPSLCDEQGGLSASLRAFDEADEADLEPIHCNA